MARQIKADLVVKDKATKTIKKVETQTTTSFDKMKGSANGLATAWKSTIAPITALVVASAALTKAFKNNIAYGDKLGKISTRLGINVKALDKLNKIADLSAVSHEKLATSLQRLTRRIAEAAQGTGVAKDALQELGLDANRLARMTLDEKFLVVASALDKVQNQGDKVRLTMKLMDSEGVTLIQMFGGLESKFNSISSMWDNQSAKSMEEFGDNLTIIGQAIGDISVVLTQEMVDMINNLVDIKGDPNAFKEWSENAVKCIKSVAEEAKDALGIIGEITGIIWDLAGLIETGIKEIDSFANKSFRERQKQIDQLLADNKKLKENPTSATKMFGMSEKRSNGSGLTKSSGVDQEASNKIKEIQERTQQELSRLIKLSADERVAILTDQYQKESSLLIEHGEETTELHEAYRLKVLEIGTEISDKQNELEEAKLAIVREAAEEYNKIGKSQLDLELERIDKRSQAYKNAGVKESIIEAVSLAKKKGAKDKQFKIDMDNAQKSTGMVADNLKEVAEMQGKFSKEGFAAYKAFKIAEIIISTITGAQAAAASAAEVPFIGPALAPVAFATFYAAGMANVAMVAAQQPPSYDVGGISNAKGIYQTGDIQEAHIPIPSGKIPVELKDGNNKEINIINNITIESSGKDTDDEQAKMIANAIDVKIRESLVKEQRCGGLIHRRN